MPEVVADVADKKGEKLDYALKNNGKIIMIVECKPWNNSLEKKERDQLERYFNCRHDIDDARVAILTNGLV